MYRVKNLKNGLYQLHSKKYGAFEGTRENIIGKCLQMDLDAKDIAYVFRQFDENNKDMADFGVLGGLLYVLEMGRGKLPC
jgi:hypothetical protein